MGCFLWYGESTTRRTNLNTYRDIDRYFHWRMDRLAGYFPWALRAHYVLPSLFEGAHRPAYPGACIHTIRVSWLRRTYSLKCGSRRGPRRLCKPAFADRSEQWDVNSSTGHKEIFPRRVSCIHERQHRTLRSHRCPRGATQHLHRRRECLRRDWTVVFLTRCGLCDSGLKLSCT